jgi:hypothetical protein
VSGGGGGGGGGGGDAAAATHAVDYEDADVAAARAAAAAAAPLRRGRVDAALRAPRAARGWTLGEREEVGCASRGEIVAELARLGAAVAAPGSGRFVLLADAYARTLTLDALRAAAGEGWPPHALPRAALAGALPQHPPALVDAVLARVCEAPLAQAQAPDAAAAAAAPPATLALNARALATLLARGLLGDARARAEARGAPPGAPHLGWEAFLTEWAGALERAWPPGGAAAPPRAALAAAAGDWLRGIALRGVGDDAGGVAFFPEDELPADPKARFAALFAARAAWAEGDLLAYVEPLAAPHRKAMDMVANACRVTINRDKTRVFSAR